MEADHAHAHWCVLSIEALPHQHPDALLLCASRREELADRYGWLTFRLCSCYNTLYLTRFPCRLLNVPCPMYTKLQTRILSSSGDSVSSNWARCSSNLDCWHTYLATFSVLCCDALDWCLYLSSIHKPAIMFISYWHANTDPASSFFVVMSTILGLCCLYS